VLPGALLAGALALWTSAAAPGEPTVNTPHPGGAVVGSGSRLRFFLVGKPDQIERGPTTEYVRVGHADRTYKLKLRATPPPPKDWASPAFADGAWPVGPCPLTTSRYRTYSLLCARAKFLVADPRSTELTLSMTYRGGAVIHLNGKEVKRVHMPEGKIEPDTPAAPYPRDAWVDPKGKLLRKGFGDPAKYKDRFALRERKLEGFKLPPAALRKGVNVLGIELHRPVTDAVLYDGKPARHSKRYCQWSTLRLSGLKLEAPAGARVAGPASKLKGLRVWNQSTAQRVSLVDVPDPCEPLRPVAISGARNGNFSAQVVVGSNAAIRGLKAEVSELKGPVSIPASRVQVRYALPDGPAAYRNGPGSFDGLEESAPAEVSPTKDALALCPVWITVNVPGEAKPGKYTAKLTISAEGTKPVGTELRVSVANWTLPAVKDSSAYYWLVQSPESLAMHYGAEMWSEQHWKHLERSFELMGQVGTRIIYVPMFRESHLGNKHTMVRWLPKAGGGWKHDFSIFEKYVDLAARKLGRLDVVCLCCWPRTSGGGYFGGGKKAEGKPMKFTSKGPDGKLKAEEGPVWGTPQSRKFWKEVLEGTMDVLRKRGLQHAAMVGICHDTVPSKECVEDLKAAVPAAKWVVHCHPKKWSVHGVPAGYLGNVWGMPPARFPEDNRAYGWKEKRYWTTFPRYGSGTVGTLRVSSPHAQYRASLEAAACAGIKGYGWIGADCWPVVKGSRGRRHYLLDFYDYDKRNNLGITHSVTYMLRPGKNGPVATARLEAARMSLQENEARAHIERALLDPLKRKAIGEALAKRAQDLLDRRLRAIIWGIGNWNLMLCADWEKLTAELYATAAEVDAKLSQ
jgi:hypothetical protein